MNYPKKRWKNFKRSNVDNRRPQLLEVELDHKLKILGCWLSKFRYPRIGAESLHVKFASGTGEVVRHLCGDSRCFNPCHVVRGNKIENAKDEMPVKMFSIDLMRKITGGSYSDQEPDVEFLILQTDIGMSEHLQLREVNRQIREEYRRMMELQLVDVCEKNIDLLQKSFLSIVRYIITKEDR